MPGRNKVASIFYFTRLAVEACIEAADDAFEPAPRVRHDEDNVRFIKRESVYWKLEGKVAVPCSLEEMAVSRESVIGRQVGLTELGFGAYVSTVFLGIDHGFFGRSKLFETMVFYPRPEGPVKLIGGRMSEEEGTMQYRYTTYEEAEEGHARIVALCEKYLESVHDMVPKKETLSRSAQNRASAKHR